MTEPENPKTDEVGTTDGEAVQITESVPETAPSSAEGYGIAKQNEPKTTDCFRGNFHGRGEARRADFSASRSGYGRYSAKFASGNA